MMNDMTSSFMITNVFLILFCLHNKLSVIALYLLKNTYP